MVAAAGLLREIDLVAWAQQAPWLMLIPIGYMIASRLSRGHTAERPLYWVAHAGAAVILWGGFAATLNGVQSFAPMEGQRQTLLLGLVFAEAALLYVLAAAFQRRSINVHLAAAAACGALWQLMGYYGIDSQYYAMVYAVARRRVPRGGAVARARANRRVPIRRRQGQDHPRARARGVPLRQRHPVRRPARGVHAGIVGTRAGAAAIGSTSHRSRR